MAPSSENPVGADTLPTPPWLTRTLAVLLVLGLGASVSLQAGPFGPELRPAYLLPLLAAGWARQRGREVALPLLLLGLLPSVSLRVDFITLGFGYPLSVCVLSAAVAWAFAPGDAAEALRSLLRPRTRLLWLMALALWTWAGLENVRQMVQGEHFWFTVDVLALPSAALVLLAVDWPALAARLGRSARIPAAAVAVLVAAWLLFRFSWRGTGVSIGLGSASASSLVPVLAFSAAACGVVRWPRALAWLAAAASLMMLLLFTVGPPAAMALGLRSRSEPDAFFVECGVAVLMGVLLRSPLAHLGRREHALLVAVLLGWLVAMPLANHGGLQLWGAGQWAPAGLAFLGGWRYGARGAVGTTLALLALSVAAAVTFEPGLNASSLTSAWPALAGLMLAYGLGGWLAARRARAAPGATALHQAGVTQLDVSAVARVVQAIDQATTMRSFWGLLIPALVLWQWVQLTQSMREFLADAFNVDVPDTGGSLLVWVVFIVLVTLTALGPAIALLVDWLQRQDRWRWIHGLTAGVLALVGAGTLAVVLGWALSQALAEELEPATRIVIVAVAVALSALAAWWTRRSSTPLGHAWRLSIFGLAMLLAFAGLWLLQDPIDRRDQWLETVAGVLLSALVVAWWVRAIRLRVVLAEDRPRALLYGQLPAGRLWVRVAALLGLPSSMWQRSALRGVAAWALLLARPLVYLGATLAKATWPVGVAVMAVGHGLFAWGKRRAAAALWEPQHGSDGRAPILFLRSFEDDQFDFDRPAWQLRLRWYDLWSFRRNLDEAMADEVALYGPVVALGRPGEAEAPFGAQRHYASHKDWQALVIETARRARAIVLVAGESPGLRWEFELLRRERLLERTLLLLHPAPARQAANARAIGWLLGDEALGHMLLAKCGALPVALWQAATGPVLLTADAPSGSAALVALRAHFQRITPEVVASVMDWRRSAAP